MDPTLFKGVLSLDGALTLLLFLRDEWKYLVHPTDPVTDPSPPTCPRTYPPSLVAWCNLEGLLVVGSGRRDPRGAVIPPPLPARSVGVTVAVVETLTVISAALLSMDHTCGNGVERLPPGRSLPPPNSLSRSSISDPSDPRFKSLPPATTPALESPPPAPTPVLTHPPTPGPSPRDPVGLARGRRRSPPLMTA